MLPNSIYNIENLNSVHIYPNPTHHQIHIDLKNDIGKLVVKLYNITGQQISETVLYNIVNTVDLPSISGVYYIEVFTQNGVSKHKVVVE